MTLYLGQTNMSLTNHHPTPLTDTHAPIAMPFMPYHDISLPAIVLAKAIGSVGFALSVLAIAIGWFLTAFSVAEPTSEQQSPLSPHITSRRSHRTQPSSPVQIYSPHPGKHNHPRHVSFTPYPDPPPKSVSPEKPSELEQSPNSFIETQSSSPSQSDNSDLLSSESSSGPASSPEQEAMKTEPSRSSSRPPPLRLPRIKNVFSSKRRKTATVSDSEVTDSSSVSPSINSKDLELPKSSRKTTWSISLKRASTVDDSTSRRNSRLPFIRGSSGSTSAREPSFPSKLSSPCNHIRRQSSPIPIPRTHPYEYPYYAAPPVAASVRADPTYSTYLKGLPQFENEMNNVKRVDPAPVSDDKTGKEPHRSRSLERKVTADEPQLAIPHGRGRCRRPICKHRSVSESWASKGSSNDI